MKLTNSPIDKISLFEHDIYIKRDDLLHKSFSGNKARKFAYFVEHQFPEITKLIGYGSPQANSLYSMSELVKLKGWQLDFYVDHIAKSIIDVPKGNYAAAIENGANIIDLSQCADRDGRDTLSYIKSKVLPNESHALFVPEGGRCEYAYSGVKQLACEIAQWCQQHKICAPTVMLPSGTGTTALFLNRYFVENEIDIKVLTCATVGGSDYLTKQFFELSDNTLFHPQIINLPKKYHFGKLYRECYEMWQYVSSQGITFELLYDPIGFIALEHYIKKSIRNSTKQSIKQSHTDGISGDRLYHQHERQTFIYIHQGGLLGNETMLPRYQRKFGR